MPEAPPTCRCITLLLDLQFNLRFFYDIPPEHPKGKIIAHEELAVRVEYSPLDLEHSSQELVGRLRGGFADPEVAERWHDLARPYILEVKALPYLLGELYEKLRGTDEPVETYEEDVDLGSGEDSWRVNEMLIE